MFETLHEGLWKKSVGHTWLIHMPLNTAWRPVEEKRGTHMFETQNTKHCMKACGRKAWDTHVWDIAWGPVEEKHGTHMFNTFNTASRPVEEECGTHMFETLITAWGPVEEKRGTLIFDTIITAWGPVEGKRGTHLFETLNIKHCMKACGRKAWDTHVWDIALRPGKAWG